MAWTIHTAYRYRFVSRVRFATLQPPILTLPQPQGESLVEPGHDYRVTILPSRDLLFRQSAADTKADGVVRSDAGAAVAQAIAKRMLTAAITTRAIAKTMLLRTCKSLNSARELVAYFDSRPAERGLFQLVQ